MKKDEEVMMSRFQKTAICPGKYSYKHETYIYLLGVINDKSFK
jgi:hypothetical protein